MLLLLQKNCLVRYCSFYTIEQPVLVQEKELGDVVINNASVRMEGASKLPCTCCRISGGCRFNVDSRLIEAAKEVTNSYHVGISVTTDSFGRDRNVMIVLVDMYVETTGFFT